MKEIYHGFFPLELQLAAVDLETKHSIYWHLDPKSNDDIIAPIDDCHLIFTVKSSLMEIVQSINPGQTLIPEWAHHGAILGVQGGTQRMLDILNQVLIYKNLTPYSLQFFLL